eukprot:11192244-Lingulodinium_polyedra.AAC.1
MPVDCTTPRALLREPTRVAPIRGRQDHSATPSTRTHVENLRRLQLCLAQADTPRPRQPWARRRRRRRRWRRG